MNWVIRPLRLYAVFQGRSTRREFWSYFLVQFLLLAVLVNSVRLFVADEASAESASLPLIAVLILAFALPNLAVSVRRLHDIDKPWWFILLGLVPVIGWLFWVVMMVQSGTDGPNSYGDDPRD